MAEMTKLMIESRGSRKKAYRRESEEENRAVAKLGSERSG
ncbi:uncharacterized protein G2W53_030241 [Senna tora]|uniref:Uncharacterized protein n=1 Tax=Senna tora TaxID=362788 RepID=A0A834T8W6_9FABA|nr:uncharacterized protein G2W53_030241 [Senna tora]